MEFLRTGALGPLTFGLTPAQVISAIGMPLKKAKLRNPAIWNYGGLDVTLLDGKLVHLSLQFAEGLALPDGLPWEGWMPTRATKAPELQAYAARGKLVFVADPALTFHTQGGFTVGRTSVVFSRNVPGGELDSITASKP